MATQNSINGLVVSNGLSASGKTISTIANTKGELIVGDGVNSSSTLSPGSDYQLLEAKSANATGLGWVNGTSTSNDNNRIFGYGNSVSNFTFSVIARMGMSNAALVANTIYFLPFNIYKSTTFTKIGVSVTTSAASSNIRLGIYNCDNDFGFPGSLVLDAGTIDSSSNGDKTITISQTLFGKYWLCLISNGTPSIATSYTIAPPFSEVNAWWGVNSFGSTSDCANASIVGVSSYYSALPATVIGDTILKTNDFYLIYLQV